MRTRSSAAAARSAQNGSAEHAAGVRHGPPGGTGAKPAAVMLRFAGSMAVQAGGGGGDPGSLGGWDRAGLSGPRSSAMEEEEEQEEEEGAAMEEEQEEEAAGSLPALRRAQIFWNTVEALEERYVTSPLRSRRLGKRKKANPPPPPTKKRVRRRSARTSARTLGL
eukprot:g244.t1